MSQDLPAGPPYPAAIQGVAFWNRPLAFLERCRARYGNRFTMRLPVAPPFVMHSDPAHVKEIYTAPPDVLRPGQGARVLAPVVGWNSVILLDEAPHMAQRKLMLPAFHGEKMARLAGLMEEVAEREIATWPRDEPVALHPRMQRLTLEIILRAVFGLDAGERLEGLRERLGAMLVFGDRPISLMPPTEGTLAYRVLERVGPFARFAKLQAGADELIFGLIAERRAAAEERDDILSMLLAARHEDGSPMSEQEVRDELMTMLVAGHETTASTLAWAFERLPRHPEVIASLRDEMEGGDDAYLTATLQEVLRRRPVLPNTAPRFVAKPVEIGGRHYEPGCALVANAYLVHHDPETYPDPYAFRPERFIDEAPGTYTFIPFGGGRRRCLGASFAMAEMKIVMRAVLGACDLQRVGTGFERPQRRNITIRPGNGATVALLDRSAAGRAPEEAVAA
ncbi:MAG TPA: cytochrome P450 [Thermoleophilaceae bacterium]|nr:cytochrome P450 [Thermoleophilaceae bacterium]